MEMDEAAAARYTDEARKRYEAITAGQEAALRAVDRSLPPMEYLLQIDEALGRIQTTLDDLADEVDDSGATGEDHELLVGELMDSLQRVADGRTEMQRRITVLRDGGQV